MSDRSEVSHRADKIKALVSAALRYGYTADDLRNLPQTWNVLYHAMLIELPGGRWPSLDTSAYVVAALEAIEAVKPERYECGCPVLCGCDCMVVV